MKLNKVERAKNKILDLFKDVKISVGYSNADNIGSGIGVVYSNHTKTYFKITENKILFTETDYLLVSWYIVRDYIYTSKYYQKTKQKKKIDDLLKFSQSPLDYELISVEYINFYKKITRKNFFQNTYGRWKNFPKGIDLLRKYLSSDQKSKTIVLDGEKYRCLFVSNSSYYFSISLYPNYIIRISDHWSKSKINKKRFNCEYIRSCYWELKNAKNPVLIPESENDNTFLSGIISLKQLRIDTFLSDIYSNNKIHRS